MEVAPTGAGLSKISGRMCRPTNHSFAQKTRLNVFFVWYLGTFLSRFVTIIHAFDGRTDGQTDSILIAKPHLHYMQRGKNVAVYIAF